jgi:hypothetical protein
MKRGYLDQIPADQTLITEKNPPKKTSNVDNYRQHSDHTHGPMHPQTQVPKLLGKSPQSFGLPVLEQKFSSEGPSRQYEEQKD